MHSWGWRIGVRGVGGGGKGTGGKEEGGKEKGIGDIHIMVVEGGGKIWARGVDR